jgi:hypothetical protein
MGTSPTSCDTLRKSCCEALNVGVEEFGLSPEELDYLRTEALLLVSAIRFINCGSTKIKQTNPKQADWPECNLWP